MDYIKKKNCTMIVENVILSAIGFYESILRKWEIISISKVQNHSDWSPRNYTFICKSAK